ncbi:porin family protein [uncultured Lutibacter sp.]|uniref:porin family protein n=1 Tax=uncultured Lutibacter sp. TaxID=437739 RepID=UPI002609504B|nr:porin family protein [uncultured Lutibacter sp.]
MIKKNLFIVFLFSFVIVTAQEEKDSLKSPYLEDQLYLSLTYNILTNKPSELSENGFSGGLSFGFIKDVPFNIEGKFGLGLGLGYGYNVFIQNLKISKNNFDTTFELASDYKSNSLRLHSIDIPFELRWRNSTLEKYKFFRVYAGIKASYLFISESVYKDDLESIKVKKISEINKFQYGLTLSAGYSTWNLFIYYGLNPIFKEGNVSDEPLDLKDFKIGVIFYIM